MTGEKRNLPGVSEYSMTRSMNSTGYWLRNESRGVILPKSARLREFLSDPVPVIWAVGAS
jgi:hypothetical protein